nr:MAG TPA: winged helix-turn-helix domain protein [Caudoviricetes sp.]
MMAVKNESLLNFVQDYQIHLIDPAKLSKEDLEKFSTSLREVIGYIKYSKDKKRLTEFLTDNPRMLMEANAARVIKAVTNTPLDIPEDAEVIDVCKAVEDMMNESKAEGAVAVLAGLVKDGLLSIKEAAHRANMTESEFEAEVKKLS